MDFAKPEERATHIRGVALGLLTTSRHVPILREYLMQMLKASSHVDAKPIPPKYITASDPEDPTDYTRAYFYTRYTLTPDDVQRCVDTLAAATSLPFQVDCLAFETVIKRDTL